MTNPTVLPLSPPWLPRLVKAGATQQEVNSLAASYQASPGGIQTALDSYVGTLDTNGLTEILGVWRTTSGPFGAGLGGGGLPFGTNAPVLTGNPADDQFFMGAGTGVKQSIAGVLPAAVASIGATRFPIAAYGAKSDGSTDDTAAAQAADAAAAVAGGWVTYPLGKQTVIGGQVTISPGVRHCSEMAGPFDPNSLANAPIILVPNNAVSPFAFASRNAELSDLLFYYPNQIAVTSASNPTVYPAVVTTPAGSAGCKMRRLTFANAYQGFNLLGGRHIIEDIFAGCLSNVWTLDNSLDVVHFRRIVANPFWNTIAGLGYPQTIDTWVNANKVVGQFFRADAPVMEDIFGFAGLTGLRMDDTALALGIKPSYGSGSNVRFDTFTNGIICKSTQSPGWQIANFSCNTSGNPIIMAAGGGTAPKLRIMGGAFWGVTGIANTAGGLYLENVQNYNPLGILTPPSMPASGSVLANPFPTWCAFIVTAPAGVTVSAIGIGPGQPATGVTVAAGTTSPPIMIGANEGVKLTYTGGTPTWVWFGY